MLWSLNYTSDVYTIVILYPPSIFFLLYLFRLFARMVAVMMLMLKNNRLAVLSQNITDVCERENIHQNEFAV